MEVGLEIHEEENNEMEIIATTVATIDGEDNIGGNSSNNYVSEISPASAAVIMMMTSGSKAETKIAA